MKVFKFLALIACISASSMLEAQRSPPRLSPRSVLTLGAAPGCRVQAGVGPGASIQATAASDRARARNLFADAQDASLVGDLAAARTAFEQAGQLDPRDERLVYEYARVLEAWPDSNAAMAQLCRYLDIAPAGREAADVRERLGKLVPVAKQQAVALAREQFQQGLTLLEDRHFESARQAFDAVLRTLPESPEALFNRGLASAAMNERSAAINDLSAYMTATPGAADRDETARAIDWLRKPGLNPGRAFVLSFIPGASEFYVRHPWRGAAVAVAGIGGVGLAYWKEVNNGLLRCVIPNGLSAPLVSLQEGCGSIAAALTVAFAASVYGAIDAIVTAQHSQDGSRIIAAPDSRRVSLVPLVSPDQGGLAVTVRF